METEELELLDEQEVENSEQEIESEKGEIADNYILDDPFMCPECRRAGYCIKRQEAAMQERRIAELLRE